MKNPEGWTIKTNISYKQIKKRTKYGTLAMDFVDIFSSIAKLCFANPAFVLQTKVNKIRKYLHY